VVLVSAPAGYGKSTLVAQWSELDPRVGCWVQLAAGDNDPVALLARIAATLERAGPVRSDLLEELSRTTPRIVEVALPVLAADLAGCEPFVLVLDDVHLVTSKPSRSILGFLAEQVPSGSQLVLVTRGDPGVRLGRLRASGDLVEVGATLLALDMEETRAVAARGGLELSEESAVALRERTEGWAAGVALATISLRDRDDADTRAAGLTGTQQQIADYLLEEVLDRQPENLKTFLLGTSILDRMTSSLCDAVLGTDDAAVSLDALARSNAFVVPLDDRGEWYRYHHLFSELLQAELNRRHPESLPRYLERAASWCEVHGSPDEAFAYAHQSGDLVQAGRIALRHWDELTGRGRIETLRLWLDRCTEEEITSDAQLSIAGAWVSVLLGDPVRASRFVAAAERRPLDVPSADGATSLRSALALVRTAVAPDGIHGMLRDAEFTYAAEKRDGTRWLLGACRALGTANILLGRPREAIDVLGEALALSSHRPELAHVRFFCLGYMAFAAAELGDRRHAQRWAVEAVLLVEEARLNEIAQSAVAYAAGAMAQQQRGDYAEAARQLENVRRVRPLLRGVPWLEADVALRCADVSLNLGDLASALELALVASDALQGYPDAGTLSVRLQRLDERIRRGKDYELTPAELRLIGFLQTHLSLQEIADRLYLSRPTVKTQVASIYHKLGVTSRSEAVEIVEQTGLGAIEGRLKIPDPDSD
jgi:LuxR family transcriptional regulator, maltose regulon positive regulatory protein